MTYPSCPCCIAEKRSSSGKALYMNPRTPGADDPTKYKYLYMCAKCIDDTYGTGTYIGSSKIPWPASDDDMTSENHAEMVAKYKR